VAYRKQRGSERTNGDLDREIRALHQEVARGKAKLALAQKKCREIEQTAKKPASNPKVTKTGVGGAAGLGVAASGTKEVLDWLWEIIRYEDPFLYDFIHLDAIDAGIMAMITSFFVWIGGRKK
jgi:hypothetical protein